jgi:hypothetical protein
LEDLVEYHTEEVATFSAGQFFFAGALWLAIDKYIEHGRVTPVVLVCLISMALGAILIFVGFRQINRKRSRLTRLLNEVEEEEKV